MQRREITDLQSKMAEKKADSKTSRSDHPHHKPSSEMGESETERREITDLESEMAEKKMGSGASRSDLPHHKPGSEMGESEMERGEVTDLKSEMAERKVGSGALRSDLPHHKTRSEMGESETERSVITDLKSGMPVRKKLDSWSDLPPDIVINVAGRLSNIGFVAFRSACSSWRQPVPLGKTLLSRFLPVVIPPLDSHRWELSKAFNVPANCVLSAGSVYILRAPTEVSSSSSQSAGFFLLFAEEFVGRRLWLRNPLSRSLVSEIPYYMPNMLNLLDFDAVQVGKFYSISSVPFTCNVTPPYKFFKQVIKVVVFPNGSAAVALCDTGILRVLKLTEGEWEILNSGQGKLDDIVDYDDKVFGVDRRGKLYSIEYDGGWEMTVAGNQISGGGPGGGRRKRLVVSAGEMYLVVRCLGPDVGNGTGFKVFKLILDERRWVQVNNLGNQTFFVGVDLAFTIPAEGFGGHCKNCILFTEETFPCYHSMGRVYLKSRKDDLHLGVFRLDDGENSDLFASPAYSRILWPPPLWLQSKLNPLQVLESGTRRFNLRIKGEITNPFKVFYCEQQFLDYAQFFKAMEGFIDSEVNAATQSLLKCSTSAQAKMGVNHGIEEENEKILSDEDVVHSTRIQSNVLAEVYGLFQEAVRVFENGVCDIRREGLLL